MYRWRSLSATERDELVHYRRQNRLPWHSPPHYEGDSPLYLITAACYEHRPVIGFDPNRILGFEQQLLATIHLNSRQVFAWCVLPNHYHVLIDSVEIHKLLTDLGLLHGRTSHAWNGADSSRGRKVWCGAAETSMKSERHFWATFNYVLHNAVHHGYVTRWQDWPFSNAAEYLKQAGRDQAERTWRAYPVFDYGKDWDPPEL